MKKISLPLANILVILSLLVAVTDVWAELGSTDKDMAFTPVLPCRILDTRSTSILNAGATRGFYVVDMTSFQSQGGASSNCNLPKNVLSAIVVNFTVVSPTTGGYITAFPYLAAQPLASTMNFNAGDVKGNFSIMKIS